MKQTKLGLLALIGLAAVASIFTVCKAVGANGNVYTTSFDQTIEVGYGQFRALQPTEKKLLNIVMPVDAEEPVAPVELGRIALSDGEYILGIEPGEFPTDNYTVKVYDLNGDGDNNPATPVTETPEWPLGANQWAVNFELDGGTLSGLNPRIVNAGESVSRPEPDPDKEDFNFEGWYGDAALSTLYDFASPVIANISVWAKWTAPRPMWTTFIYNDGVERTVSLHDDAAWVDNSANARLAQLSVTSPSLTFNNEDYQKASIKSITWGQDVEGATSVNYFLVFFSGLTSVDLSPLSEITDTGDGFLYSCTGLTELDLSPLSGLTTIGQSFLNLCTGLSSLDLSALNNITTIGRVFLDSDPGIVSLTLPEEMPELVSIGEYFMRTSSLTSLTLPPMPKLTSIGYDFLRSSHSLLSLDLSALPASVSIGNGFLQLCSKLASVNMGAIPYDHVNKDASFAISSDACQVKVTGDTSLWTGKFTNKGAGVVFENEE
jgi:uncharacterized repeat protein (TIGR02543 family)